MIFMNSHDVIFYDYDVMMNRVDRMRIWVFEYVKEDLSERLKEIDRDG